MCEDIGAEPLPILNCGMACQFNSGQLVPVDDLDPYIQDALDLVEFANGPASSEWGGRRAALGHPAPFHLKLLGVGNEQWGPQYIERYAKFAKALKTHCPEIQLVAASGPDPEGERFDFLWSNLRALNADLVDEHYYRSPQWFLNQVHRYDHYPRTGPKVFAGEYAAHVSSRANNLQSALAAAAMMTGLERNADVVRLASYAPLFAQVDAWQWRPNLIWFDNLRVFGTPDYYVQQLFSRNRGDVVLPVLSSRVSSGPDGKTNLFASSTRDEKAGEIVLKVVNVTTEPVQTTVHLNGVAPAGARCTGIVLTSGSLNDENSLETPRKVSPKTAPLSLNLPDFDHAFPAQSMTVLRITVKR